MIRGIDVAVYQAGLDWAAARRAGVRFAIIKATQDGGMVDGEFTDHLRAARRAGIDVVGAYHFLISPRAKGGQKKSGAAQAEHFIRTVRAANGGTLDGMLLALDVENLPSRGSSPSLEDVRSFGRRFRQLAGEDRPLLLYTSPGKWGRFRGARARDALGDRTYLWMADWRPRLLVSRGFGGLKPIIHQHGPSPIIRHRGRIVDGNTSSLSVTELRRYTRPIPKAEPAPAPVPVPEPQPPAGTAYRWVRPLPGAALRPQPTYDVAP
ncbi:MAG: hypothetical protein IT352_15395, partial [Gemmatimonadales bacterium]|nr:hypothetical protein [Gemmatimonadales bacterium]